MLGKYGFSEQDTPIIKGSAVCAMEDREPEIGVKSIQALMKAVDEWIPTPQRDLDKPFLQPVEAVHSVQGRGTVVTGRVERGTLLKGQEVVVVGFDSNIKTTVTGIEMFHKELDRAEAGDNLGVLLRGIKREDIRRGMVIAAPGSISAHKKLKAQLYALTKDEGGRHTPFVNNYCPQLYTRTADVSCSVELPKEVSLVMPGENVDVTVSLKSPIAIENGSRFTLREGGKTVATGIVTSIMA